MLSKMGVSQALFDRTCDDSREYDFLLPTRETFLKYGIRIEGEQDRQLADILSKKSQNVFSIE